jgi:hypothetical protein
MEISKSLFRLIELNKDTKKTPHSRAIGIKNHALYSTTPYMASRITAPEQEEEEEGVRFFEPHLFLQSLRGIFAVRNSLNTNEEKLTEASSLTSLFEKVDSLFDGEGRALMVNNFDPVLLGRGIAAINAALAGIKRLDKNIEIKYSSIGAALLKTKTKAGLIIDLLIMHKSF